ncbi:hypothetical protein MIR68_003048 [Amoeboaphelidium protococcarum]|nr:hypothetical protein MIR68_003048 [Amoeboaphelidium protococcarum]
MGNEIIDKDTKQAVFATTLLSNVRLTLNKSFQNYTVLTLTQYDALGNFVQVEQNGNVKLLFGASDPEDTRTVMLQALIDMLLIKIQQKNFHSELKFPLLLSCSLKGPEESQSLTTHQLLQDLVNEVANSVGHFE